MSDTKQVAAEPDPDPPTLYGGYYSTKAERKRWNGGIDPKEEAEKATKKLVDAMAARQPTRAHGEPPKDWQDVVADLYLDHQKHMAQQAQREMEAFHADVIKKDDSILKLFPPTTKPSSSSGTTT